MSLKNKLFEEMFSTFATGHPTDQKLKNLDPTQPMGQPNPWTTLPPTGFRWLAADAGAARLRAASC